MASEEVKKILGNLQTLKDTKTGSGEEVDKIAEKAQTIEPENYSEELSEEERLKKELEEAIAEQETVEAAPKAAQPEPVAQEPRVVPQTAPQQPSAEQIIQAEVEALNNDGVFRHALLQRLNNIEQHLHVMAIAAVKIGDVNLGAENEEKGN